MPARAIRATAAIGVGLLYVWPGLTGFALGQPPAVSLPATSELSRLLDLAALRLNVPIDYDPSNPLLKGQQVTLRTGAGGAAAPGGGAGGAGGAMSDVELWATVSRVLVQRGLTTVRAPGSSSLTVVKLDEAARLARLEPVITVDGAVAVEGAAPAPAAGAAGGAAEIVAGYRNQPVRLRHVSVKEANETLRMAQRGVGGSSGSGGAGGSGGGPAAVAGGASGDLLMLSDTSPRIEEQLALLRQVDTAENATVVQGVAASNVSPVQLAAVVMQLATKRELVSGEKLPGEVIAAAGSGGGVNASGAAGGGAGGGGGSVMIVAPRRAVERWKQLIALADQREPVTTTTYAPRLFAVKEVGSLVTQIAGAASGGGAGGDDRFRVIVEEPTGSLIVTATPTQHEKIAALMERLDSVPGEARRPVRSFVVRNRSVVEFVATLQQLVSAGVLDGVQEGSVSQGGSGGPPPLGNNVALPPGMTTMVPTLQPPSAPPLLPTGSAANAAVRSAGANAQNRSLAVTLTSDEPTNTIIAVGDGRLLDQLGVLIKTLDVRQPQVMLEAYMVSLVDSDIVNIGVELDKLVIAGATRFRLASLFDLPDIAPTVGGAGTPGGNALVLDPGDFSAVIQALQTLEKGRTISLPKVLVSNNQRASFNAVQQQPYAASFTAGNASTPTTSYGGSSDAGTQLTIRPQIGEGGSLLLDYNISISQFAGGASSDNLPPPRDVTSVQSLASIPDGYTVVVGGMQTVTEGSEISQVPLIGSIPGIGELFKKQSHRNVTTRFFVFIKATVMRDQSLEALRYASDVDAGAARLPTSWPKSAPQVVR